MDFTTTNLPQQTKIGANEEKRPGKMSQEQETDHLHHPVSQ